MTDQPPAGWYPDPQDRTRRRYWDGTNWAEASQPAEDLAAATQPIPRAQPSAAQPAATAKSPRPWWKRRWVQVTAAALVAFFAIGGIASAMSPQNSSDGSTNAAPTNSPSAPAVPPATVTVTATPKATHPAATAKRAPKSPKTQRPSTPPAAAAEPVVATWTMPDETGKTLQAAQDHIQLVSGNPLFFSTSTDASGSDRMQLWDRDWRVCDQTPQAGTKSTEDTPVDFSVVKLGETCP